MVTLHALKQASMPTWTIPAGTQGAACACDGYSFHAEVTVLGFDISKPADGIADNCALAKACDQTPGCVAFTSDGWLKSQRAPLLPGNAHRSAARLGGGEPPQHAVNATSTGGEWEHSSTAALA